MNGAQIPITETGYHSHFLPEGIVEEHGGPEACDLDWFYYEAEKNT